MAKKVDLEALLRAGYARTSNNHQMVSRIDRHDWREHMAEKHAPWDPTGDGMDWVKNMGAGSAADYYRRCHSRDTLTIDNSVTFRGFPPSSEGPEEFQPHVNDRQPENFPHKRLQDMTVVLTGSFHIGRDRLRYKLGTLGIDVKGSVSAKSTDVVVAGENAGSKESKAREWGVPVITVETLAAAVNIAKKTPALKFRFR